MKSWTPLKTILTPETNVKTDDGKGTILAHVRFLPASRLPKFSQQQKNSSISESQTVWFCGLHHPPAALCPIATINLEHTNGSSAELSVDAPDFKVQRTSISLAKEEEGSGAALPLLGPGPGPSPSRPWRSVAGEAAPQRRGRRVPPRPRTATFSSPAPCGSLGPRASPRGLPPPTPHRPRRRGTTPPPPRRRRSPSPPPRRSRRRAARLRAETLWFASTTEFRSAWWRSGPTDHRAGPRRLPWWPLPRPGPQGRPRPAAGRPADPHPAARLLPASHRLPVPGLRAGLVPRAQPAMRWWSLGTGAGGAAAPQQGGHSPRSSSSAPRRPPPARRWWSGEGPEVAQAWGVFYLLQDGAARRRAPPGPRLRPGARGEGWRGQPGDRDRNPNTARENVPDVCK